jgi:citrate synthase
MQTVHEVQDGLEGVLAFASEIAEPDRDGGSLRYRGVDVEELVGALPFEGVWGLLVEGRPDRPLAPAGPHPLSLRTGDTRVDVQSAIAALAPEWGFGQLVDVSPEVARDQLARTASATLSFVAQSARGAGLAPVPQSRVDDGRTLAERFLLRWRGEADPDEVAAIDAYWITAAEHGMNASTFTARVVASTGADVAAALSAAVGALSGPLHGGAPARVLKMMDAVERDGDADRYVAELLGRGERIMGFGHRIYRAEDPRARALARLAEQLASPRLQVAKELERAALAALAEHKPDRVLATNVEFWSAVVLDHARVPQPLFTPLFVCARTAGWSAHILEQHRTGRLIRPASLYVGPGPRPLSAVLGDPVGEQHEADTHRGWA